MHTILHKCAALCKIVHTFWVFVQVLFLQFGIAEPGVVDGLQLLDEHGLGIGDIAERDGTILEITFGHLCVDEFVDEFADALLGIVGHGARGGFYRVGHHQNGLFLREGVGTWIGEEQLVDIIVGMGVLILYIEVLGLALSVVSGDKVLNHVGQIILLSQFDALCDMTDDHLGTVDRAHLLMGIHARLVFGEVDGVEDFPDIMVQGACAYELAFATDLIGDFCSEITHLDRVLECARSYFAHLAEKRLVHVRQFDKGNVRREVESLLNQVEQGVGAEKQYTVDGEIIGLAEIYLGNVAGLYPFQGQVG